MQKTIPLEQHTTKCTSMETPLIKRPSQMSHEASSSQSP